MKVTKKSSEEVLHKSIVNINNAILALCDSRRGISVLEKLEKLIADPDFQGLDMTGQAAFLSIVTEFAKNCRRDFISGNKFYKERQFKSQEQSFKLIVTAAGDHTVGIPDFHEEVTVTFKHGGHDDQMLAELSDELGDVLKNFLTDGGEVKQG